MATLISIMTLTSFAYKMSFYSPIINSPFHLVQGERYFVRVSAYNMKGFGPTQISSPPSAVPSSWHDINNSVPRYEGCTDKIHLVSAQFELTLQAPPILPSGE